MSAVMVFLLGTQEQVQNGRGKQAISVQATEVLLYLLTIVIDTRETIQIVLLHYMVKRSIKKSYFVKIFWNSYVSTIFETQKLNHSEGCSSSKLKEPTLLGSELSSVPRKY